MKRILLFLAFLAVILSAFSQKVQINGSYYILDWSTKTAGVTYYSHDSYNSNDNYVSGDLKIPEIVNYQGSDYTVTSIGERAFEGCKGLTRVEIPNSVISIEWRAFAACGGLTSVEIPNSITSIGGHAFEYCSGLTSVEIPNSVTSLGGYAFENCSGLTSVTIPNSITYIGGYTFWGCSSLTSVEIPNSVTSIENNAFAGCRSLTSVEIPNSVTYIGVWAFSGCSSLTSVEIPNSVTEIGGSAFEGCSKLATLTLGSSLKSIYNSAFSKCPLKNINSLNNTPPTFASYTFSDYTAKVIVPAEAYDKYKASDWVKFMNLTPGDLTIEIDGIVYRYNLSTNQASVTLGSRTSLTYIQIPGSINIGGKNYTVTEIDAGAFKNYTNLKEVILPSSLNMVGSEAFSGCTGLIKSAYPKSISSPFRNGIACGYSPTEYVVEDGIIYNTLKTNVLFVSMAKSGSFALMNSVKTIETDAFRNCSNLTSLTLGAEVSTIKGSAFVECTGLKSIQFEGTLEKWCRIEFANESSNPLYYAHKLLLNGENVSEITVPSTLTSLGNYTFINLEGLREIIIPSTITLIGSKTFYGCNNIEYITSYRETPPSINTNTFSDYSATLYVPVASEDSYKGTYWRNFKSIESIAAVYLGIIGFNGQLREKNIGLINELNVNQFTDWVSKLQLDRNTLLYYTVDNAIDKLTAYKFPTKLSSAAIITFTDGLDQGSLAFNSSMSTDQQYLNYLANKISNTKIQDVGLKTYTIGVEGVDVVDENLFRTNLETLASSRENAYLISDFNQIGEKFDAIYNNLAQEKSQTILTISIPMPSDKAVIRFTLDGSGSAETSKTWIQGTFNRSSNSLTNVKYNGLTSSSGNVIAGVQEGLNISFNFGDCRDINGSELIINSNSVDQWTYITSSDKWQHNVEMGTDDSVHVEKRNSAAIMLLIDCSSSLGAKDFVKVLDTANAFIERLINYTGKNNGIEGIIAEEDSEWNETDWSDAVYYNLQGIRVINPSNGIYIRIKGNRSQKVILQ